MARTLEEMDLELTHLRTELDALKVLQTTPVHPFRQFAGCFTGDEELERIFEEIEASRRIPDPGLPAEVRDVAA